MNFVLFEFSDQNEFVIGNKSSLEKFRYCFVYFPKAKLIVQCYHWLELVKVR